MYWATSGRRLGGEARRRREDAHGVGQQRHVDRLDFVAVVVDGVPPWLQLLFDLLLGLVFALGLRLSFRNVFFFDLLGGLGLRRLQRELARGYAPAGQRRGPAAHSAPAVADEVERGHLLRTCAKPPQKKNRKETFFFSTIGVRESASLTDGDLQVFGFVASAELDAVLGDDLQLHRRQVGVVPLAALFVDDVRVVLGRRGICKRTSRQREKQKSKRKKKPYWRPTPSFWAERRATTWN